jgi:subtilase family serine protease
MPRRRVVAAIAGATSLLALTLVGASGGHAVAGKSTGGGDLRTQVAVAGTLSRPRAQLVQAASKPPTDAFCRKELGFPCYTPQEIRNAYGLNQLIARGDDGKGETIVIVDSYGSPTIASDLAHFDAGYGLPAPPSFKILAPLGTVKHQLSWAAETTLDVEWSHAMAPDASIVLLTSPVNETQGVQGMPQFDALENYALDHHLGQVISQSWATTENDLFSPAGRQVFDHFEATYATAAAEHVTVLGSTGDSGSANPKVNGKNYTFPTINFPSSSPLVTAVGGTSLYATTHGSYKSETVWNSDGGATGGGISQYFPEPFYQRFLPASDQAELDGHRGTPDISWNADPNTPILVYLSYLGPKKAGYYTIGGTSEGSPDWAGFTADLDQFAGHPIGLLNPYLYALGAAGVGFHDVTVGNNSIDGVPGYSATPGWDAATGWGSPDLGQLLPDIASLARGNPSPQTLLARAEALRR